MAARLITEADVSAAPAGALIRVDRDTVITPAALDRARLRGIPVWFERDGTPCPSAPAPVAERTAPQAGAEAPRPEGLGDGSYLLVVRDGVSRVYRLSDRGQDPEPLDDLPPASGTGGSLEPKGGTCAACAGAPAGRDAPGPASGSKSTGVLIPQRGVNPEIWRDLLPKPGGSGAGW